MAKKKSNKWNREQEAIAQHRKKLPVPIRDHHVIAGTLHTKIQERVNPRQTGDLTTDPKVRELVLKRFKYRCFYCHRRYTLDNTKATHTPQLYFHQLEIDHLVPHSKRGPNRLYNYVPACKRCNQLKSNYSMAQFKVLLMADKIKRGY